MGRWAQAQRRGSARNAPAPGYPLAAPAGTEWTLGYDDPSDVGFVTNNDAFPAGADGIRWGVGPTPDIDSTFGVHTGLAGFTVPNPTGNGPDNSWAFAWTLAGVQVSEFCAPIVWQSV